MDDLTGFVTGQSDGWEILNLLAIAEADEVIPISETEIHCRKAGEALSPVREPVALLESLEASTRQRPVLGAVSANASPAWRRDDQAQLD